MQDHPQTPEHRATCQDCLDGPPAPAPLRHVNVFEAHQSGPCLLCDDPISAGQKIARMTRDPISPHGAHTRPATTAGYAHYHHLRGAPT